MPSNDHEYPTARTSSGYMFYFTGDTGRGINCDLTVLADAGQPSTLVRPSLLLILGLQRRNQSDALISHGKFKNREVQLAGDLGERRMLSS